MILCYYKSQFLRASSLRKGFHRRGAVHLGELERRSMFVSDIDQKPATSLLSVSPAASHLDARRLLQSLHASHNTSKSQC